jgi:hypothetical protein
MRTFSVISTMVMLQPLFVSMKKMIQKVGDRENPTISIKDYAFCVNASPMSDIQQFVLEYEEKRLFRSKP